MNTEQRTVFTEMSEMKRYTGIVLYVRFLNDRSRVSWFSPGSEPNGAFQSCRLQYYPALTVLLLILDYILPGTDELIAKSNLTGLSRK